MKTHLKRILILVAFTTTISSGAIFAQDPLATVEVTGSRSNWNCTGSCIDRFYALYSQDNSNIFYETETAIDPVDSEPVLESAQRIPGVLQCAADANTRNSEAWLMYRSVAIAARGTLGAISWDSDQISGFFSFMFIDGSIGIYQRTDSEFRASDGMTEIKAPCGN